MNDGVFCLGTRVEVTKQLRLTYRGISKKKKGLVCICGRRPNPFWGVWSPVLMGLWWFLTLPRSLVRSTISVA